MSEGGEEEGRGLRRAVEENACILYWSKASKGKRVK